jgi:hypothetical protein
MTEEEERPFIIYPSFLYYAEFTKSVWISSLCQILKNLLLMPLEEQISFVEETCSESEE